MVRCAATALALAPFICEGDDAHSKAIQVRVQTILNARTHSVCKYQPCMFVMLRDGEEERGETPPPSILQAPPAVAEEKVEIQLPMTPQRRQIGTTGASAYDR